MKAIRTLLVATLLLGPALVPAGAAPTPPASGASEMAAGDVSKWLTFFDKLVETVVRDQSACDKMAVDVNAVMDANRDAITIARNAKAEGKKLPDAAKQRMVDGVKKMMPGMQNCGTNDKVRAAFLKLDLNRRD